LVFAYDKGPCTQKKETINIKSGEVNTLYK
jgi:hypothetical protein